MAVWWSPSFQRAQLKNVTQNFVLRQWGSICAHRESSVLVGFDSGGRFQKASLACAWHGGISQGTVLLRVGIEHVPKTGWKKFSFAFRKPALEITTTAEILGPAIEKATKQGTSHSLDMFSCICLKGIKLFKTIPIKSSAKIVVAITCLPFQWNAFLKQKLMEAKTNALLQMGCVIHQVTLKTVYTIYSWL